VRAKPAKVYQFPYRAVPYTADVRIDDPIEEFAHGSPLVEVGATFLAFVFWMGWRLTHLSLASR
jgi:hypothetical protein